MKRCVVLYSVLAALLLFPAVCLGMNAANICNGNMCDEVTADVFAECIGYNCKKVEATTAALCMGANCKTVHAQARVICVGGPCDDLSKAVRVEVYKTVEEYIIKMVGESTGSCQSMHELIHECELSGSGNCPAIRKALEEKYIWPKHCRK